MVLSKSLSKRSFVYSFLLRPMFPLLFCFPHWYLLPVFPRTFQWYKLDITSAFFLNGRSSLCSPGIIPFLTMRSFSEERKLGTLHVLMTAPVSPLALVLGKWLASVILLFTIFGLTFCYPILTTLLFPAQSLFLEFDNFAQWASIIIFLFFYGASFTAIGIFSSTLTKNQMVSGMLTFTLISIYLAIMTFSYETAVNYNDSINAVEMIFAALHSTFNGLAKIDHFSLGLVDLKSIFHQLLVTIFFLFFSVLRIERLRK